MNQTFVGAVGVVAQASDRVTIDNSTLTAIWGLLAVLTIVVAWALYELRRRRRMALRLDRLGATYEAPRYPTPTTHDPEDFEALLDGMALDERLPEMVADAEAAARASHETDGVASPGVTTDEDTDTTLA